MHRKLEGSVDCGGKVGATFGEFGGTFDCISDGDLFAQAGNQSSGAVIRPVSLMKGLVNLVYNLGPTDNHQFARLINNTGLKNRDSVHSKKGTKSKKHLKQHSRLAR